MSHSRFGCNVLVAGTILGALLHGGALYAAPSTASVSLVKDIKPGADMSAPRLLAELNGFVYFVAVGDNVFPALYKTDGTAAGTTVVREFAFVAEMASVGNKLFLSAADLTITGGLWVSDGTAGGTVLIKPVTGGFPGLITDVNGTAAFILADPTSGVELWKSNGTPAGTVLVKDIVPGAGDSLPEDLRVAGTKLFFTAETASAGRELYVSDLTSAGTFLLKDIWPGTGTSTPAFPTAVGSVLFFAADDSTSGPELWKSDGTTAGTARVKDINPGAPGSNPESLEAFGSKVYFSAFTGASGTELFVSDGTAGGTGLFKDIRPGTTSSVPEFLTSAGSRLFFQVSGGGTIELWVSDGTSVGTKLVGALPDRMAPGASETNIVGVRGTLLFAMETVSQGIEPWFATETTVGLARDIFAGTESSDPDGMLAVLLVPPAPASPRDDQGRSGPAPGGPDPGVPTLVARVFFAAEDGANGRELWRADITEDIVPLPPVLNTPTSALVVGATNTLTGSRITPGTVVKLFVATASGPVAYGPYTPSGTTTGSITFAIPASVPLGNGFVAVQVVATDVGYLESNVVGALLYGDAADGIPTILTINGQALAAPDLSIGLAHADTVVGKGATVTITGTGFSSPLVNLFTATGNVGPLTPLGGGTSTSIQVQIPAGAPTGPGNFQVVNRPSFTAGNAVASIIGARPAITSVSVSGATVTVNGAGFSVISVINLFNLQGGSVVNLGGYGPGGVANVPLTLVNDTRFTFTRPAGAAAGQAFVEVLNPPYTPFSSSGSDPDGAFSFPPAPLILTDAVPAHSGERPAGSTAEAADGAAGGEDRLIGVNVLLNTRITPALVQELGAYGRVRDQLAQISAVTMQARAADLPLIARLPFVEAANPDVGRTGRPIDLVPPADFEDGLSTWNLDAVNVTDLGADNRQVPYDGAGVYVAVLDTGLLDSWRQYFPQERIAVRYARAFGGGGGLAGWVSSQPNKWEHDQDSHGTHVASTIIGYSLRGAAVNGVAPQATIIPVKVLNQNGNGWSSVVARGVMYVAELKRGPLAAHPVVINMSLGGATLDAVEQAAIDYAVANGVVIVASAGNAGQAGMGFPGAYAPVISVAASGWTGEWVGPASWWSASDVGDPAVEGDFYITSFSSRARPGQDLDVAAPGSWVLGPYQLQSGRTSYYFLGGTSMASPHVAGIVALMLQKNPGQGASLVESRLEAAAIPLAPGCRNVTGPSGTVREVCWGADATGAGLITADAALAAVP